MKHKKHIKFLSLIFVIINVLVTPLATQKARKKRTKKIKMVTILCCYTVIPSESTPTITLPLSHCDQTKLPNHGSQLFVFANTSNNYTNSSVETLRASLSKALVHYYPFAGRLSWIQVDRLQLLCNSKGALLFEATCHHEIKRNGGSILDGGELVGDFALQFPPHLLDQLVPKVDYGVTPIEDMPLLLAQSTIFSCGGITLGLTLCRAVVDGYSVGSFMSSWAKFAREGEKKLDSEMVPLLDRTVLDSLGMNVAPRFQHAEFSRPPISEEGGLRKPHLATAILKLTKGQVLKLKKKANGSKSELAAPFRPYTSFEAISGYLWRCVCKVRCYEGGNGAQRTRLTTLVNCRNKFRPPLPHAYFGNATFPTVTPTCSFDDIARKPLGYAVGNVREAVERMNDEYLRSAIDYIASQKEMSSLRENLYGSGGGGGNPNLYVVSWANFPFYDTDFGWGKPACLLPGSINSEGKVFLMNDGSSDGFVVAICLHSAHADSLKKLFYEDMEELVLPNSKL